jgi:hypothetical protein
MKALVWGAAAGVLGLLWITGESVMGLHETGHSYGPTILWLIIPPICSIGSMAQHRLRSDRVTYGKAVATGAATALMSGAVLLVTWIVVTQVLEPDYLHMMIRSIELKSTAIGEAPAVTEQRLKMAHLIFDGMTFFVLGGSMPMISGGVASLIAALGLQRKGAGS